MSIMIDPITQIPIASELFPVLPLVFIAKSSLVQIILKIFAFVKINILYLQYIRNLNILK